MGKSFESVGRKHIGIKLDYADEFFKKLKINPKTDYLMDVKKAIFNFYEFPTPIITIKSPRKTLEIQKPDNTYGIPITDKEGEAFLKVFNLSKHDRFTKIRDRIVNDILSVPDQIENVSPEISLELKDIFNISNKEEPNLTEEADIIETKFNRKKRDEEFRVKIKEIYNCSCAICGKRRFSANNNPEVESAHIFPKKKNGSDDLRNGLALCKLHHWAFDNGLIAINENFRIIVDGNIKSNDNYKEIFDFEDKQIIFPSKLEFKPHPLFLKEHKKLHKFE